MINKGEALVRGTKGRGGMVREGGGGIPPPHLERNQEMLR